MSDPDALQWQPMPQSSNVARAAYDGAARELIVEFSDGSQYAYGGTTENDLFLLVNSPSPGSYVFRNLKRFPARKLG